jgi:hypothetical protein
MEEIMALNGYVDGLAAGVQDYIFGYNTYVPGTNFYVALSTTAPDPDGGGYSEPPAANNYARVPTQGTVDWSTASIVSNVAITVNSADITFNQSLVAGWGLIVAALVFDSPTIGAGTPLFGGMLTTAKTIDIDTVAVFLTNDFVLNSTNQ